jgi:CRISPR-associated protein Cas8a1/Csx13
MTSPNSPMTWRLSDPGMGILERAGLAALYMSLRAAEEQRVELLPLQWDLKTDSVTLCWEGADKIAMTTLMRWAWQVRDKVLFFPAVHRRAQQRDYAHLRVLTHNGVLNTFLQHVNVQRKGEVVRKNEQISDGNEVLFRYQSLDPEELMAKAESQVSARRKKADAEEKSKPKDLPRKPKKKAAPEGMETLRPIADLRAKLFARDDRFRDGQVSLSSWVKPGTAPRFGKDGSEEAWCGSPKLGLLLMLAPICCLYQRLPLQREKQKGKGPNVKGKAKGKWTENWAFVVPDVRNLEEFNEVRPNLSLDLNLVDVASLGDAAMRFEVEYATSATRRGLHVGCQVTAMGKVPFYEAQSVRKGVLDFDPEPKSVRRYLHLHRALGNRYVSLDKSAAADGAPDSKVGESAQVKASGFIKVPSGRGRIADNLVMGRPWYCDLFTPLPWDRPGLELEREKEQHRSDRKGQVPSIERLWFRSLSYQRSQLVELIQEVEMWDTEDERLFVEVFSEAIRSLYRQEAKAAERGGSRTVKKRWEHLNGDIYRALVRSKTRDLLRATLCELFARAGRWPTIQKHAPTIWNLMNDPYDWKRARDLSLLALATYQKREGYDLRLMSSVNDVSGIPTAGNRLIIAAVVDQVLHFRIFNDDGKMVVDTDEKSLTKQAQPIEDLRKQLESLWPPHELTDSEEDRVIATVTSIVGHTEREVDPADDSGRDEGDQS